MTISLDGGARISPNLTRPAECPTDDCKPQLTTGLKMLAKKAELVVLNTGANVKKCALKDAREDLAKHPAPAGCNPRETRAHERAQSRVTYLEGEVAKLERKILHVESEVVDLQRELDCAPPEREQGTLPMPPRPPLPNLPPRPTLPPPLDPPGSTFEPPEKGPVDLDPAKPDTSAGTVKVVPWTAENAGTADSSLSGVARNQLKSKLGDEAWTAMPEQQQNELVDNAWRHIYAQNKTAVGNNPDLVHPGLELKIPADLVKLSAARPEELKIARQIRG